MDPISLAPVRAARVILKRIQIHRLSRLSDIAILTVDSVEALEKLRKWEQGDKSLYSIEALEARYKNRTNKEVYRYLSIWWASAMALESQFGSPQATVMSKAVYLTIYIRVSKGLLEAESEGWDEAALAHLVEEAWEEESNGMGHLRRSQFNDSLFELVDMWTNTTEAAEYVDVLRRLHGCCFDGAGSFFSDAAADAAEDDPGGGGPHTLPNMVRGAKGGLHQPREDVILGAKHPSQQERARRSGEHKQRRAAVTIQTSTRKRQATHKLSEKKQAVTSIQARTRVGAVRTANLVQRVDESEMWRQWRSGNDGQQAIMSWSDRAEAGRKRDDAYNRSFGPRDADPQPPFTEEKKRVEVRRGEDCGKQGQLQYWALRKGLPPRLQEAFDELSEKDQVAVAHLSEEKQLKFLRDGLTDKGVPNDVVAARGMLDQHLRAQFNDLSRADQGALAKLSAEKLVLYLGGAAVQTSPAPRRPPAATPAADLQPISSPASPARELDLVRDDLERRAYATERANVRRYHEQSLRKSGEDGALQDHCGGHARGIGIGSGGGVGFRGGKGIRGSSEVPEDWRVSTVGTLGYMYAHQQCGQASAMACARVQTRDGARDGASPRLGARDGASFSPRSPPPSREIPTALCARDGAVPARELLQIYFPTALGALKLSPQPSEHPSFPHSPRSTQAHSPGGQSIAKLVTVGHGHGVREEESRVASSQGSAHRSARWVDWRDCPASSYGKCPLAKRHAERPRDDAAPAACQCRVAELPAPPASGYRCARVHCEGTRPPIPLAQYPCLSAYRAAPARRPFWTAVTAELPSGLELRMVRATVLAEEPFRFSRRKDPSRHQPWRRGRSRGEPSREVSAPAMSVTIYQLHPESSLSRQVLVQKVACPKMLFGAHT